MKMRKSLLQLIKVVVFLGFFYLFYTSCSNILVPKNEDYRTSFARTNAFYALPKDSIDVLFLGASTYFRGITPLEMWENYGFTSYIRSVGGQAPAVSYYYLVESLKYQKPKVVVIDASTPLYETYAVDEKEGKLRNAIDSMRLSIYKFKLVKEIVSRSTQQTFTSYLFPLLRYHSRWDELVRVDFEYNLRDEMDSYKGILKIDFEAETIELPENYMQPDDRIVDYSKSALDYYQKMFQFCEENDIAVVLVTMPRVDWGYSQHFATKQLADRYNIPYVDYCLDENLNALDLNLKTDFHNKNHLTILGAQKVSRNLGAFLQKTYNLKDKRNDPAYQQWNLDLRDYKEAFAAAETAVEASASIE